MTAKLGDRSATVKRLYAIAVKSAKDAAGGDRAFNIIGATYRQALVSQAILQLLDQQDESVADGTVRFLLAALRDHLTSDDTLIEGEF